MRGASRHGGQPPSSRKSVPPWGGSKRRAGARGARERAHMAERLARWLARNRSAIHDRTVRRASMRWMACAASSLPVPVGPRMRTESVDLSRPADLEALLRAAFFADDAEELGSVRGDAGSRDARRVVRRRSGAEGDVAPPQVGSPSRASLCRAPQRPGDRPRSPYGLPASGPKKYTPIVRPRHGRHQRFDFPRGGATCPARARSRARGMSRPERSTTPSRASGPSRNPTSSADSTAVGRVLGSGRFRSSTRRSLPSPAVAKHGRRLGLHHRVQGAGKAGTVSVQRR
jgi:hypothetical protein